MPRTITFDLVNDLAHVDARFYAVFVDSIPVALRRFFFFQVYVCIRMIIDFKYTCIYLSMWAYIPIL